MSRASGRGARFFRAGHEQPSLHQSTQCGHGYDQCHSHAVRIPNGKFLGGFTVAHGLPRPESGFFIGPSFLSYRLMLQATFFNDVRQGVHHRTFKFNTFKIILRGTLSRNYEKINRCKICLISTIFSRIFCAGGSNERIFRSCFCDPLPKMWITHRCRKVSGLVAGSLLCLAKVPSA